MIKPVVLLYLVGRCLSLTQNELDAFYGDITLTEYSRPQFDGYIIRSTGTPQYESDGNFGLREIAAQNYVYRIPQNPSHASETSCAPMGIIGFAINGVPFFNPYTSSCCNAGVALDGYPIYNEYDESGVKVTEVDLDECRGRYTNDQEYRYHLTDTFPYTLGCFRGEVIDRDALRAIARCACTELATEGCDAV